MMQDLGTVAADTAGAPVALHTDTVVSFDVEWGANLTATLLIQVTNRDEFKGGPKGKRDDSAGSTDWQTIAAMVFPTNPAASASRSTETFSVVGWKYCRLLVDYSAGTGGNVTYWAWSKRA
jgi:hypothetical protein